MWNSDIKANIMQQPMTAEEQGFRNTTVIKAGNFPLPEVL